MVWVELVLWIPNTSPENERDWLLPMGYPSHSIHGTGIFTYICCKNQPNESKYTIHGWYGPRIPKHRAPNHQLSIGTPTSWVFNQTMELKCPDRNRSGLTWGTNASSRLSSGGQHVVDWGWHGFLICCGSLSSKRLPTCFFFFQCVLSNMCFGISIGHV